MSWAMLHAGKFVGDDGVVLDRAEHEFLARSADFPERLMTLIAREDPARRLRPVEWLIHGHLVKAGFTQMSVRVDGQDYCLRVIDHQAFEGSADRTGRAYRKRTYLAKATDEWGPGDADLPLDLLVDMPHYTEFTTCPEWSAPADAPVDVPRLKQDLETLMATGRFTLPAFIEDEATDRLTDLLAALPAKVASHLTIHIGQDGTGTVRAPGAAAEIDEENVGCGDALLRVLRTRGATRATRHHLATAAKDPWQLAAPQWDHARPFSEIRADLSWLMRCEAWLIDVDRALEKGKKPPNAPLPPSERLLKAAVDRFVERDAIDRLGILAGKDWESAWQRMEVPQWKPVIDLLAGRSVEDADLTVLSVLPLGKGVAERAISAWQAGMATCSHETFVALFRSPNTWCHDLVASDRTGIIGHAMQRVVAQSDPVAAWAGHPLAKTPEGRTVDDLLAGNEVGPRRIAQLQKIGQPCADLVSRLGDSQSNAAWFTATGIAGAAAVHPPLAATLDWLGGRPVTAEPDMVTVWQAFDAAIDIVASLQQGVPPHVLETALSADRNRVVAGDAVMAVVHLLARGDEVNGKAWTQAFGHQGAWALLDPDATELDADNATILDGLTGTSILGAMRLYRGAVRPAWTQIDADAVLSWLLDGRSIEPLGPLAAAGAQESVAIALMAFTDRSNTHPVPTSALTEGRRMLERLLSETGFLARQRLRRHAKRLEVAA